MSFVPCGFLSSGEYMLDGLSGFLGAVIVGFFSAALSPVQPFGSLLLHQELLRGQMKGDATSASLLTDLLRMAMTDAQITRAASLLKTIILTTTSWFPAPLAALMYGLQDALQSVSSMEVLRACSTLLDLFVAEFLCCCILFLANALLTSSTFYFKLKHGARISLAVLMVAAAAGLPHCRIIGKHTRVHNGGIAGGHVSVC